jgi:hypothetical protein
MATQQALREAAPMLGVTDQQAVRLAAQRAGLPPEQVTPEQVTAARDELLAGRVKLDAGFEGWYRNQLSQTGVGTRLWADVSELWGAGWQELRRKKAEEYRVLRARTLAQSKADDEKREALAFKRLSPLERFRRVQDHDEAAAQLATYRTRHRAHAED